MPEDNHNQSEMDWEAVVRKEREQRIRELEDSIARGRLIYRVMMLNALCLSINLVLQLWQLGVSCGLFH